ncbi:ATP-binding protein [Streptomyces sp. NPDC002092]
MGQATEGDEWETSLVSRSISESAAFEGCEEIGEARDLARRFLEDLQADHGVPVSAGAMGMVQLVVSELVTNAHKFAPGPMLLTLELNDGALRVSVWDTEPGMPVVHGADPSRVGQHGLELVMAICPHFEVHREPVGKRVVATVLLADDAIGDVAGPPGTEAVCREPAERLHREGSLAFPRSAGRASGSGPGGRTGAPRQ